MVNAPAVNTGLKAGSDEHNCNDALECIDLEDPATRSNDMESITDTISIKTEFEVSVSISQSENSV